MLNPYVHTFGLKAGLVASFLRGATMQPIAVFDLDRVVDLIDAERITMLPGPPTLYHSLLTVADKGRLATLRARHWRRSTDVEDVEISTDVEDVEISTGKLGGGHHCRGAGSRLR